MEYINIHNYMKAAGREFHRWTRGCARRAVVRADSEAVSDHNGPANSAAAAAPFEPQSDSIHGYLFVAIFSGQTL